MNHYFPIIVAHNGFDNTPINSIDSIIKGINEGADYIEIDIRVTKDNVAVLFHDDALFTEKYGNVKICDITYSELDDIITNDQIASCCIPDIIKLKDAVIAAKEFGGLLNLDMKDGRSIDPSVHLVKSFNMSDSVVFSGCELSSASYLKTSYPELQVMLNLSPSILNNKKNHTSDTADEICRMAISVPCCGININYKHLFDNLIKSAARRYLPLSIWTLSAKDKLEYYLNKNIFSITTLALQETMNTKINKTKQNRIIN